MKYYILSLSFIFGLVACGHMEKAAGPAAVPVADKQPFEHKIHGDVRVDNYQWMKERDSQKVLNYIQLENAYAESNLKPTKKLAESLFGEMKARIKEDDSTYPYQQGGYFYYSRFEKNKEYPIYCRKKDSLANAEEVILDVNVLAQGKKYYSAQIADVSPNHEWLAFSVDEVGRRFYTIHFKNLKTGEIIKDVLPNTTGNWVWANDNKTGFYTQQEPNTLRSDTVYRFALGDKAPVKIYFEKDELFNVYVYKSLNQRTIFLATGSFDSSEAQYLAADQPLGSFKMFSAREKNVEYWPDDGGDGFYLRTNYKAKNFRLMKANYGKTERAAWTPVIPHREKVYLQEGRVFQDFFALEVRENGLTHIEVVDRRSKKTRKISFPDPAYVAYIGTNREYKTETLRYNYSSLVQPSSIYDFDLVSGKSTLKKTKEVPTYNSNLYATERVWVKVQDGTKVPVSLVYKKDLFKKNQNPLYMYGYGSYGYSMDADFNPNIVSFLDRGFVYAIAHVRGGQELGRDWYEQGRLMKKKNTFSDFVQVTENLLKDGYGKAGHVYAEGGSAGGLLMGAILNLRPDLYHGVLAAVPFVDVVTTMLDSSIPLTTAEYEQWGNPNEKRAYDYIKSYSPYDNVKDAKYPNILVTTGYHDSQVQYWEPLKWTAKLRDHNKGSNLILMKTEMAAGHSGMTGRFASTKEDADNYAFLVWLEEANKL